MSGTGTSDSGFAGQLGLTDDTSDYNKYLFVVTQVLGLVSTATLVKVVKVSSAGEVAPVGVVDVQPLVNMLDGQGKSTSHDVIHNLPYFRVQGGANAIILDPQVGDIGIALFADRDISSVKATKAQANPGSFRRFDMADGLYIGGVLNGVPNQYVAFSAAGINVMTPGNLTINVSGNTTITSTGPVAVTTQAAATITASNPSTIKAPVIILDGAVEITGHVSGTDGTGTINIDTPIVSTQDITTSAEVSASGIPLSSHRHTGVQTGGGDTGPPTT